MTAEELFRKNFTPGFAAMPAHIPKYIYESMIEFAQMKVEEALKAGAEKAKIITIQNGDGWSGTDNHGWKSEGNSKVIDKKSILNAYPKENIK